MRKISRKGLWKKAKETFNKWVRRRNVPGCEPFDGYTNTCITCKKRIPVGGLNAGHFYHGKQWQSAMDERNVWPQCVPCNKYKHGNLIEYSEFLRTELDIDIIDTLRELRHQGWKPSREELEDIIRRYET